MIYYDLALKAIDNAIDNIDKIKSNLSFEELKIELYASLIDSVHKIADYYVRTDKNRLSENDKLWFNAFYYLNNQIKHDQSLEIIYQEIAGSMFPLFFPMRFGDPCILWSDFHDNGWSRSQGKREHYDKVLNGKDVKASLNIMRKIITGDTPQDQNSPCES